jgi:hypothetical protein
MTGVTGGAASQNASQNEVAYREMADVDAVSGAGRREIDDRMVTSGPGLLAERFDITPECLAAVDVIDCGNVRQERPHEARSSKPLRART